MRVEIGQIFTQIISFLIMLWVLKRYAWKPLLGVLEERKNKIITEFDTIEKQKKENDQLTEEYRKKLEGIDAYARAKTLEAIEVGKQKAYEIQNEAHQEAKVIIAKVQIDLQKEVFKAKEQLKNEMVKMTVSATEKMIQKNLSEEEKKTLLTDFIEEMGSK